MFSIRVIFSIGDIDAEQDEEAFDEEVSEESADQGSGGEGDEKSGEDSEDVSFPVRAAITITKAGSKGALSIDAVAQGMICSSLSSTLTDTSCRRTLHY